MVARKLWTLTLVLLGGAELARAQAARPSATPAGPAAGAAAPAAQASPARRSPSPAGTAATIVGVTWSAPDANGRRRFSGGKWIEVTYNRPLLRGRTAIFGSGADYGKAVNDGAPVWRAGAGQTTKLSTEVALEIGGKRIEPGSYDVFVDLKETGWTLILSTQPAQERYDPSDKTRVWGSMGYDPKYDVLRAPMLVSTLGPSLDQFTIAFTDMTDKGGKLVMAWERTAATVPFTVVQ